MAITVANALNLNHFPTIIVNKPEVAWIQANNTCLVFALFLNKSDTDSALCAIV